MLNNYLKIALRALVKHKGYSLLNLFGLAVGMAACLLILLFITNERSFDTFHSQADQLYRFDEIQSFPGITPQHVALSMYPMGPSLKADYPEVLDFVRVAGGEAVVTIDGENRIIDEPVRVDPSFFTMFDFPVLAGDPATAFENPNTVALTASTARSLFGTTDVLGKQLTANGETLDVVGLLEDVPAASHLQFDALFTMKDVNDEEQMENWGSNWLVTYVLLAQGTDQATFEAKLPAFKARYLSERSQSYYKFYLQPLLDVHLGSTHITHDYRNWQKFDERYIYIFGVLAFFVLAIASINFMNLATARSATRSKEVGVRKSIGAQRGQVAMQFLGESVLLTGVALIVAVGLTLVAIPFLNQISDRSLHLGMLLSPLFIGGILGTTLLVGLLSGLYPAFFLSAFEPVRVLKGLMSESGRKTPFRNVLVVTQFAIAIALIVGTTLTMQQLDYMRSRDNGFNTEQVMVLPMSEVANEHYDLLKEELLRDPAILDVTGSGQRLGNNIHQWGLVAEGETEDQQLSISNLIVDFNYLSFYEIELTEGRMFSEERGTDNGGAFVINEALAAELGWEEPLGKRLGFSWRDSLGTVIGVARDFNFNSLHHQVEPLAMSVQDFGYSELSIRVDGEQAEAALAAAEQTWNSVVTDRPFEYAFLDDHFDWLYASDRQVSQVIGVIAGLAIIIACLGLFGLAAITTEQRTKEIGVRKVLGASVSGLVLLLSKEFTRLVFIAFLIAAPVTYFVMRDWLADYAYRIDVGVGVFLFAGVVSLLIALGTVSYRAIKAARANPVKALRYE